PNPTNGPVLLSFSGAVPATSAYEVIDLAGKVVQRGVITGSVLQLDLSGAPGMYTMRMIIGDSVTTGRVLVQ
ncbi:MAG: T9SS type A sorting domain-containing protein, partial [Flavobacteriales bacterium]